MKRNHSLTSKRAGFVAGAILALTLVLPAVLATRTIPRGLEEVSMLTSEGCSLVQAVLRSSVRLNAFFIGGTLLGLGLLISSWCWRGRRLAVAYLALGLLACLLIMSAQVTPRSTFLYKGWGLLMLSLTQPILVLVAANVRSRIGNTAWTCGFQMVVNVMAIIYLLGAIPYTLSLCSPSVLAVSTWSVLVMSTVFGAASAGAWLAHRSPDHWSAKDIAPQIRLLTLIGLIGIWFFLPFGPPAQTLHALPRQPVLLLASIYFGLIWFALGLAIVEGFTAFLCEFSNRSSCEGQEDTVHGEVVSQFS